jgi:tRNA modification GTPase
VVPVSSVTGEGLASLRDAVRRVALAGHPAALAPTFMLEGTRAAVVASARHRDALERARASLSDAIQATESRAVADVVTIDLRACLAALGEITGESITDDLLEQIFSRFCIGK